MSDQVIAKLSDLQLALYDMIRLAGWDGKTCDECEAAMPDRTHQSVSARIHELEKMKLVERRGKTRKTRAGRGAAIYVAYGLKGAQGRQQDEA